MSDSCCYKCIKMNKYSICLIVTAISKYIEKNKCDGWLTVVAICISR